ncbi:MAG: DUF721 domain-containing protein [Endomicrobiales bacterium]|nr:DUF721 domain-containing protein [Endomicrobiales bacterium]
MPFASSSDIIDVLRKRLGINEDVASVLKIWDKELGPLSKRVRLTAVKKNVFMAETDSSSHLQEMVLKKKGLITKINQYFGGRKVVRDIKFYLKK